MPSSSQIYAPISEESFPYLYLASWILAVIAGVIAGVLIVTILYRLIRETKRRGIRMGTGIMMTGAGTIPWANYFETMYLYEIFSISEWIYGLVSLILILLLLDYSIRLEKTKKHIIIICGAGVVIFSLCMALLICLGFPVDAVYGEMIWRMGAIDGLFFGGIVLLFLGNWVFISPDNIVYPIR